MRFLTAGESHGPELLAIIEGLPAGIPLTEEDINPWLERRQKGYGRGRRMVIETDRVEIRAGVRAGRTTGAPVALAIKNADYRNWVEIMDPAPGNEPRKRALTAARPGHADLSGGHQVRPQGPKGRTGKGQRPGDRHPGGGGSGGLEVLEPSWS